jgi:RepB DNA-primase from phage plasmid
MTPDVTATSSRISVMSEKNPKAAIAAAYIQENFAAADRLAVVLLNKRTNSVIQRISTAKKVAAPAYLAWLRHQNSQHYEIYISMNALRENANGRTKADIGMIRHVYLDLDEDGSAAVDALLQRTDLPKPNYLINSSPNKWQVIWKVEGFGKEQAEGLQKSLAAETGADPAATDCARVLRLPGFYNHKYTQPHFIRVQSLAERTYQPAEFPAFPSGARDAEISAVGSRLERGRVQGGLSQSERDWAYAKRALIRGDPPETVIAAIATWRRYDKHNPRYYAELTVRKAAQSLGVERERPGHEAMERGRS